MIEVEIEFVDQDKAEFRFPGQRWEGKLSRDELSYDTIEWFSGYLERAEEQDCGRDLLKLVGRHLFRVLFADPIIKERFVATCDAKDSVQVRLEFRQQAMTLARLPWEFLFIEGQDVENGKFLAQHDNLVLVRHVEWQGKFQRGSRQLKVLVVVQSPQDKTTIATSGLEKLLDQLAERKGESFTRRVERNLDWNNIRNAIRDFKPDVFHFAGHGGTGALWLAQAESDPQHASEADGFGSFRRPPPVTISQDGVAELFRHHKPRLVILDACDSGVETAALPSVAHAVLRAGVQAAVAMRYKISNAASEMFSTTLYSEIAAGRPLDMAVQQARVEVACLPVNTGRRNGTPYNDRAFGTPVLYLDRSESVCDPLPDRPRSGMPVKSKTMVTNLEQATCPECSRPAPSGNFCIHCGCQVRCMQCTQPLLDTRSKFCPECGIALTQPGRSSGGPGHGSPADPTRFEPGKDMP